MAHHITAYTDVPLNHAPGQVEVRVTRNGTDHEGRAVYAVDITGPGVDYHRMQDLRTGVGSDPGPDGMLATLTSYLTACAESYPDGENADLFPPDVAEWAAQHSDEITMLGLEHGGI